MQTIETPVTKLTITDAKNVSDPIHVIFEDIQKGVGLVTITNYGKAWVGFFQYSGSKCIRQHFKNTRVESIYRRFTNEPKEVNDYEALGVLIKERISKKYIDEDNIEDLFEKTDELVEELQDFTNETLIYYENDLLNNHLGDEWYLTNLPQKNSSLYRQIKNIILAIKEAI
ncbi:hypothetical protein [Photobacterium kishitanii]|uniref:Uncharacterized protein n=1 Tax=Photobacterium kishitanii TaxID=318456 RepID=A0A2T3KLV6_9GAMM|nr:hypothetical protein [Photobacterium kishitanii]PSV00663.1 hypothetical protein C9J27_05860 [Photobacterium kishitanii]